jgi:Uma2 family endonuclease
MATVLDPPLVPTLRFDPCEPLTDARFARLCAANPDLRLERSAEGNLIIMSPAGSNAGRRNSRIISQLDRWAQTSRSGLTFDSSAGFTLPNGAIRSPDASWITWERWNALSPAEREGFAPLCPDFVAELRSPTDPLATLHAKMDEYLDQGARLGWLIDPIRNLVEIHRPGQPVEIRSQPTTLSGEDVLPGFTLDLTDILDFKAPTPYP